MTSLCETERRVRTRLSETTSHRPGRMDAALSVTSAGVPNPLRHVVQTKQRIEKEIQRERGTTRSGLSPMTCLIRDVIVKPDRRQRFESEEERERRLVCRHSLPARCYVDCFSFSNVESSISRVRRGAPSDPGEGRRSDLRNVEEPSTFVPHPHGAVPTFGIEPAEMTCENVPAGRFRFPGRTVLRCDARDRSIPPIPTVRRYRGPTGP